MPKATDPFDIKLDFHNPPHLNARMWARPYQKLPHMAVVTLEICHCGTHDRKQVQLIRFLLFSFCDSSIF